jgi:hypothetical protein
MSKMGKNSEINFTNGTPLPTQDDRMLTHNSNTPFSNQQSPNKAETIKNPERFKSFKSQGPSSVFSTSLIGRNKGFDYNSPVNILEE